MKKNSFLAVLLDNEIKKIQIHKLFLEDFPQIWKKKFEEM